MKRGISFAFTATAHNPGSRPAEVPLGSAAPPYPARGVPIVEALQGVPAPIVLTLALRVTDSPGDGVHRAMTGSGGRFRSSGATDLAVRFHPGRRSRG